MERKPAIVIFALACLMAAPIAALAQAPQNAPRPPRTETAAERGARMAEEVMRSEQMKEAEAARKKAEEDQAEQLRKSAILLNELWERYQAESRERKVKAEAQMKVEAAVERRRNVLVGPIFQFFDLFRGPRWAEDMRRQEEARERAREEAKRALEEKAANEALRKADKEKARKESDEKLAADAARRKAARDAARQKELDEKAKRIEEEIKKINAEREKMKETQEAIKRGLDQLGKDKKK